jgi:DNA-binding LacI/PurR family transcriptional regulator
LSLNAAIPLVLVDRRVIGLSMDCVRFADLDGAQVLAEHLIAEGHRKIGFISDEVFVETVHNRWRGYASALEAHDIPIDPRLTLFFHGLDAPYFALALRHIFRLGKDAPSAIMCSNDVVALCLLRFLHDEGIRVPDDIAVTGYGNTMPDYASAMSLTTVDQPFFELGQAAANILIERVGQSYAERSRVNHDIEIPVQLVVRGSTDSRQSQEAS